MAVETAAGTLWSAFTAKAELLGAAVMRASSAEAAGALLSEAAPGFTCTQSATTQFPHLGSLACDSSGLEVVTLGEFAVAETGSVLVNEPGDDRGRCFLADRLWVLVPEPELVATLDQALERIGQLVKGGATHPVLMSGPSRTADIERVLTIGVHGPRALVIVVVGASLAN